MKRNDLYNIFIVALSVVVIIAYNGYISKCEQVMDIHQKNHELTIDNNKLESWIMNVKTDIKEYEPCSVSVECDLIEEKLNNK